MSDTENFDVESGEFVRSDLVSSSSNEVQFKSYPTGVNLIFKGLGSELSGRTSDYMNFTVVRGPRYKTVKSTRLEGGDGLSQYRIDVRRGMHDVVRLKTKTNYELKKFKDIIGLLVDQEQMLYESSLGWKHNEEESEPIQVTVIDHAIRALIFVICCSTLFLLLEGEIRREEIIMGYINTPLLSVAMLGALFLVFFILRLELKGAAIYHLTISNLLLNELYVEYGSKMNASFSIILSAQAVLCSILIEMDGWENWLSLASTFFSVLVIMVDTRVYNGTFHDIFLIMMMGSTCSYSYFKCSIVKFTVLTTLSVIALLLLGFRPKIIRLNLFYMEIALLLIHSTAIIGKSMADMETSCIKECKQ